MFSDINVAADVELVRSRVEKHFKIYEVKVGYSAVTLMVDPLNKDALGADFEKLRKELKAVHFIPVIHYSGGEYTIAVIRNPQYRTRSSWTNKVLLLITFITTTFAGMMLWSDYQGSAALLSLENVGYGALFFAIPLMAILGVHEYCHYWAAKRHGVDASLPFFIPSIPPFGTFGAFISLRDPMPNRKALVDIGAAGPLGGLAVTIPVALMGLYLTANGHPLSGPITDGTMAVAIQPLFELLFLLIPIPEGMALHPTAFAAWVGFLVTAINLLPVGQLDGGHIARGLLGENAKYLGYVTFGALMLAAALYGGWLVFALIVLLLGLRHPSPLNDISNISGKTKAVGAVSMAVLLFTFVPQPLMTIAPDHSFTLDAAGGNLAAVRADDYAYFTMLVNNTGNTDSVVELSLEDLPGHMRGYLYLTGGTQDASTDELELNLPYGGSASVTVRVYVENAAPEGVNNIKLVGTSGGLIESQELTVQVISS